MKYYPHLLLMTLASLLSACPLWTPRPPAGSSPKANDRVVFSVLTETYNAPIAAVRVACAGRTCTTDTTGTCAIELPTRLIGSAATWIRIERADLELYREFRLPLRRNMVLTYPLVAGEAHALTALATDRRRTLDSLEADLVRTDRELEALTAELESYVLRKGPSALETYTVLAAEKKAAARHLRTAITDLRDRYRRTLAAVPPGEIVDLLAEEERFRALRKQIRTHRNRVGDLVAAAGNTLDADPNFKLRYFFETAAYRTYSDPALMGADLRAFLARIMAYRQAEYAYLADHDLRFIIQAAGYTDGQPIDPAGEIAAEIGPLCRQYGYTGYTDYNYCLGYLRAREILDDLRRLADLTRYRVLTESFGPELADGPEDNPAIRTCILSFAVYPRALEVGPTE